MELRTELEAVIDSWLGLSGQVIGRAPQYQHRTALLRLTEMGGDFPSENLFAALLKVIQNQARSGSPGAINFAFRQVTTLDENSTSREVTLERSLIRVAMEAQRTDLGNMLPVASGVFGIQGDARTAIDLVQFQNGQLSLIELKVDANTPLTAALQILCYAACYSVARSCPETFGCPEALPILAADQVRLNVLAPYEYYANYSPDVVRWLRALSKRLNRDLREVELPLRNGDQGYSLSFEFQHFPKEFSWNAVHANAPDRCQFALAGFDQRQAL